MREYDIIYVSESGFQDKIIAYLIANRHADKTYLWIKHSGDGFKTSEGDVFKINFNHSKGIINSLRFTGRFPKLKCDYLIGTQFTGINCRFFAAVINYKELRLIDDGIGTPVILSNPDYYHNFINERVKLTFVFLLTLVVYGKKLRFTKDIIQQIKHYYSVYPLQNYFKSQEKINLLELDYTLTKEVGFIGMPLVEYKMVKAEFFTKILTSLIAEYGALLYYPDPNEKWIYETPIQGLRIVKKNEPLETYLHKNGLPYKMYTFTSSALLNLRISDTNFEGFYVKIPDGGDLRELYYNIFERYNLKEYKINA